MANGADYQRDCRYGCGAQVIMSTRNGGRWAAYNLDNSPHTCKDSKQTTTYDKVQAEYRDVQAHTQGFGQPPPPPQRQVLTVEDEQTIKQYLEAARQKQLQESGGEPNKVPRHVTIKLKILESADPVELERKYEIYCNTFASYGGRTYGSTFAINHAKECYVVAIFYEIPNGAVHKMDELQ